MNRPSRIVRRLIAPLVLALLALGLMAPPASAAATGGLSGTVFSGLDGSPVVGATVKVYPSAQPAGAPSATTTTTKNGEWTATGLAEGTYKVLVTADPAQFIAQWLWNATDPADASEINVTADQVATGFDVSLPDATRSIDGTVYDGTTYDPVAGATVRLQPATNEGAPAAGELTTGADGTFHFDGMPDGDYKLYYSADPMLYQPQWAFGEASFADAVAVTIGAGAHYTGYDAYLADATRSIAGTVFDGNSLDPMSGVGVQLYPQADPTVPTATTTTSGDGTYVFTGMAAGTYLVHVTAPTEEYESVWYSGATSADDAAPLDIAPGMHFTDIDAYLAAPGHNWTDIPIPTISGTPAVGATLTAAAGAWSPTPDSFEYQWNLDGDAIDGASGKTLVVPGSAKGHTITVTVTAIKVGFPHQPSTSDGSYVPAWSLTDLTAALDLPAGLALSVPTDAKGIAIGTDALVGFPRVGSSFVAMSTGDATQAIQPGDPSTFISSGLSGPRGVDGHDVSQLVLQVTSAPAGASCVSADFAFGSEEYPEYVGSSYNDAFTIESPASNISLDPNDNHVIAPNNAAFDLQGHVISINTVVGLAQRPGTVLDGFTPTLVAAAPIPSTADGRIVFTIQDLGDDAFDSVAFIDHVRFGSGSDCNTGGAVPVEPIVGPTPTISGTPAVGQLLTAVPGDWTPVPVDLAYQWLRDVEPIAEATDPQYQVSDEDLGHSLSVQVTGSKPGYPPVSHTSDPLAIPASAVDGPVPTISGAAVVGGTLTAQPGTWTPDPVALTYLWQAGADALGTQPTLVIPASALDKSITVTVTGTKSGLASASKTSAPTATVAPGTLTAPTPTISGTPVVGNTLTATAGTWGPAPVALTYQWNANGTIISGATGTSYVIAAGDLGKTITVTVTGTKTGYTPATRESAATTAVTGAVTGTISGKVLETDGTSASGLDICLFHQEGDISTRHFQDAHTPAANGSFSFGAVPVGRYVVFFITSGSLLCNSGQLATAPYWPQWYRWGNAAVDATFVTVTSAASSVSLQTVYVTAYHGGTDAELYAYAKPTITGTAAVGQTLTAHAGSWFPAPTTVTRQWNAGGTPITGATGSSLVVTAAMVGKQITVSETASGSGLHTTVATSNPTAIVPSASLTGPTPTITGTAKVGSTLAAKPGSWGPAPVTLKYQWKANGAAISGATASTYTIGASFLGKKITLTVTGSKTGYTTLARTSAATAAVAPGTLTAPTPAITGTAKVGSTLTVKPSSWGPAPVTLKYQWKANGATISGATHSTYKISGSYAGKKITITVTGSKTGYTTVAKTSATTKTVAAGTLVPQTPAISGRAKVGSTLTANPGSWAPAPVTLKYQWKANGATISGATGKSWKITSSAKGKRITVTVTGSKTGYTTASRTSSRTTTVV